MMCQGREETAIFICKCKNEHWRALICKIVDWYVAKTAMMETRLKWFSLYISKSSCNTASRHIVKNNTFRKKLYHSRSLYVCFFAKQYIWLTHFITTLAWNKDLSHLTWFWVLQDIVLRHVASNHLCLQSFI